MEPGFWATENLEKEKKKKNQGIYDSSNFFEKINW